MRALLDELAAAGCALHRDGDRLQVIPPEGVNLDPFRDRIHASKPLLLRELLQREIAAALDVDPSRFDRLGYMSLCAQWRALPDPEAEAAALVPQLEAGWDWLASHPDHPEHEP